MFLDSFAIPGTTPAALKAGEYYYFSINTDGAFCFPSVSGFSYGRTLLNQLDSETIGSDSVVKQCGRHYQDSMGRARCSGDYWNQSGAIRDGDGFD